MVISLSLFNKLTLGRYIERRRQGSDSYAGQSELLEKLRSNGLDMPTLESIPIDVEYNPRRQKFSPPTLLIGSYSLTHWRSI